MSYWMSGLSYDGCAISEPIYVTLTKQEALALERKLMVNWVRAHRKTVDEFFVLKAVETLVPTSPCKVGSFSFSSDKQALRFIAALKTQPEGPIDEANVEPIFDMTFVADSFVSNVKTDLSKINHNM